MTSRRKFLGGAGAAAVGAILGGPSVSSAASSKDEIVSAKIHPGIGVARIGNSQDEEGYFIGPEVFEPPLTQSGQMRDFEGAMKRQAARFRVYGYNAKGEVVRELTADEADIEWEVELANKKANWYRFLVALDLPEAKDLACIRRNAKIPLEARSVLEIRPGARKIAGRTAKGVEFDKGQFVTTPVSLGELRTDGKGRLLVLGGTGNSGSPQQNLVYNPDDGDTFNNADGWYDDSSDGPVHARVKLKGRELPVESAWVIVAPPNFAPDVIGWRTLTDLLTATYIAHGWLPKPQTTSFTKDVWPMLRRLSGLQWVNKGFADEFGHGTEFNFENPELIAKLANTDASGAALRKQIYSHFRVNGTDRKNLKLWPSFYGDAYFTFNDSTEVNFTLPDLCDLHLKRWAKGDFTNDWNPAKREPRRLSDVPVTEQPAMLDRSALHYCLADAFHPGCELTWPMRHISMYSAPFRIRQLPRGESQPDWGDALTATLALKKDGPLYAQGPGDLSKWMAIPWQGDTVYCRSGYEELGAHLPTFWPARVPNHVLSENDYREVMDLSLSREKRIEAFRRRANWVRPLTGSPPEQIVQMVGEFHEMGIVEARPGIKNDPDFPVVMFVESLVVALKRGAPPPVAAGSPDVGGARPKTKAVDQKVKDAGWESREQFEEFKRNIKRRRKP